MSTKDVLSIVCSDNSEIVHLLDSLPSDRVPAEYSVGKSADEIKRLVQEQTPDIALIDVDLPGGVAYELCREIKGDETLANTHVIIVRRNPLDDESASKTASSGANDSIMLPIHLDDFDSHISQCTSLRARRGLRVAADMRVVLERNGTKVPATVRNLTANGLGLKVEDAIDIGPVSITLIYEDETYKGIDGRVIWTREDPGGTGQKLGLSFGSLPTLARDLFVRLSLFQIKEDPISEGITVSLQGGFDERTNFEPLLEKVKGASHIDFMMQGVTYLSSCGVRSWCLFIEALDPSTSYSFRHCSLAFIAQAAMVPMSIGNGEVVSMKAPYFCDACDLEKNRLIESKMVKHSSGDLKPPPLHCQFCKKALVFDDIPERFFAFLN